MTKKKKLLLGHMFLYAKGWYRRTNTLWEGYMRAICCDGIYTPTCLDSVAWIMYHTLIEHKEELLGERDDYDMYIFNSIKHKMDDLSYGCWCGNMADGMKPNAVYSLAVVWFCHDVFGLAPIESFSKILMASNKVLPLNKDMYYGPRTNKECHQKILEAYGKQSIPLCKKAYDTKYPHGKSTYEYYKYHETLHEAIKGGEVPYDDIKIGSTA